ncbi:MAG TPA: hypothetical protein VE866_05020 [Candidatus Binatia bacterium]|nr:hypothetical protein [Candidatus Binatia bacterium]
MEIDSVPVASSDLRLDYALANLRQACRSAIVIAEGSSYSLVTAADIVIALAEKSSRDLSGIKERLGLATFTPSVRLANFSLWKAPDRFLDFRNAQLARQLEEYLDEQKVRFAILAMSYSRALLVSRHEGDMAPLQASPLDCYCRTDRKAVSPGVDRGNCPHDSSHIGTVRCI